MDWVFCDCFFLKAGVPYYNVNIILYLKCYKLISYFNFLIIQKLAYEYIFQIDKVSILSFLKFCFSNIMNIHKCWFWGSDEPMEFYMGKTSCIFSIGWIHF